MTTPITCGDTNQLGDLWLLLSWSSSFDPQVDLPLLPLLFPLGLFFQLCFPSEFSLLDLLNLLRVEVFAQPSNEDERWCASLDRMRRNSQDIWMETDFRKDVSLRYSSAFSCALLQMDAGYNLPGLALSALMKSGCRVRYSSTCTNDRFRIKMSAIRSRTRGIAPYTTSVLIYLYLMRPTTLAISADGEDIHQRRPRDARIAERDLALDPISQPRLFVLDSSLVSSFGLS